MLGVYLTLNSDKIAKIFKATTNVLIFSPAIICTITTGKELRLQVEMNIFLWQSNS